MVSTHFSICVPKWQFGEISIGFLSSTQHRKEVPRGNQTPSFKQHKRPLYLFRHKSSFQYNRFKDFNRWVGIRDKPLGFIFISWEKKKKTPKNYLIRICNLWYTIRFNCRSYVICHLFSFTTPTSQI